MLVGAVLIGLGLGAALSPPGSTRALAVPALALQTLLTVGALPRRERAAELRPGLILLGLHFALGSLPLALVALAIGLGDPLGLGLFLIAAAPPAALIPAYADVAEVPGGDLLAFVLIAYGLAPGDHARARLPRGRRAGRARPDRAHARRGPRGARRARAGAPSADRPHPAAGPPRPGQRHRAGHLLRARRRAADEPDLGCGRPADARRRARRARAALGGGVRARRWIAPPELETEAPFAVAFKNVALAAAVGGSLVGAAAALPGLLAFPVEILFFLFLAHRRARGLPISRVGTQK